MVAIQSIRAFNSTLKSRPGGTVAVFVGATSGIGLGTLKAFVKNSNAPKVYVIGRSKKRFSSDLSSLSTSNPSANISFIETEISLIKNVDTACKEILSQESKVDLLYMSPGYLTLNGREETSEGIDQLHSLRYYARIRFITNLLPALEKSPSPRVVSVLAAGNEGKADFDDLDLKKNQSFIRAADQSTTMMTLALEELGTAHPTVSFVHTFPGLVNTDLMGNFFGKTKGVWGILTGILSWTMLPIMKIFTATVEEAGDRHCFYLTSDFYPSKKQIEEGQGVNHKAGSTDGGISGVYRVDPKGETLTDDKILGPYRAEGKGKVLKEHTKAVFESATAGI